MKKQFALLLGLIIVSCSSENETLSPEDNLSYTALTGSTVNTYVINEATTIPICNQNYPYTNNKDIEVLFAQPFEHDVFLSLSLQTFTKNEYTGNKCCFQPTISPWVIVNVPAGTKKVILDASCSLVDYVVCGQVTETKKKYFRVTLESAEYINSSEELNVAPAIGANEYYDFKVEKYCLGGGWNPGGGLN
ncbi:hypothetical protein [Flagellimonas pelagia]|uniref:Lipoprotein n=1 Tax=Flagellimonas pelagia TaxID=2306998 RepID=A0A3A1NM75_9FLAO|nr:hypothetical protein [Allomuricauda maritima]RIV47563.1 hypothetical protein D2V05_00240 [Allomuricauda maritima]TXK01654.1 hypothetical protein FQ017_00235 [Allomuricauda maritima]